MKFKFKGINYYEDSENNYVGATNTCSIVKEFADFQAAIDYVACLLYTSSDSFMLPPFLPHQLKPAQLIQQRTSLVISVVMITVEV